MNEIVWKYKTATGKHTLTFTWVRLGQAVTVMHAVDDRDGQAHITLAFCHPADEYDFKIGMRNTMRSFVEDRWGDNLLPKYRLLWDEFRKWVQNAHISEMTSTHDTPTYFVAGVDWAKDGDVTVVATAQKPEKQEPPKDTCNVIVTLPDGRETLGWYAPVCKRWSAVCEQNTFAIHNDVNVIFFAECVDSVVSWRPLDRPYPIQIVDGRLPALELPNGYRKGTPPDSRNCFLLLKSGREAFGFNGSLYAKILEENYTGTLNFDVSMVGRGVEISINDILGWKPYEGTYPVHFENGKIVDAPKTVAVELTEDEAETWKADYEFLNGYENKDLSESGKIRKSIYKKLTEAK